MNQDTYIGERQAEDAMPLTTDAHDGLDELPISKNMVRPKLFSQDDDRDQTAAFFALMRLLTRC